MRSFFIGGALTFGLSCGQIVDRTLTFDLAVVKRTTPDAPDGRLVVGQLAPIGGPGTQRPGRIRYPVISLKQLLLNAYGVKEFQIVGPGWMDSEFFDIEATMPLDTTKDQFAMMLQNLLIERFKLTIHRETKPRPIYSLVPKGPKMRASVDGGDVAGESARQPSRVGPDGFPVRPNVPLGRAGLYTTMGIRGNRLTAQKQTMGDLARALSVFLKRPVIDETTLTAKYDFVLTFSRDAAAAVETGDQAPLPDIFSAVQTQLGLRLLSGKGPAEAIVVDRLERNPIAN